MDAPYLLILLGLCNAFTNLMKLAELCWVKKILYPLGDHQVHVQKRLILGNLKEVYQQFKEKYPMVKVGFSKFAELRPRNCVLAGTSGTHAVCVCTIHQTVKLMMVGGKIPELSANDDVPLQDYNHCLAKIICNPPHPDCYFQLCSSCPGTSGLQEHLYELMDISMIDSVQYVQAVDIY